MREDDKRIIPINPFDIIKDAQKKQAKMNRMTGERGVPFKYSHDYAKLKIENHTTIRKSKHKRKIRQLVEEIGPDGKVVNLCQITGIQQMTLNETPIRILLKDTAPFTKDRRSVYELFQSFYNKPINFDKQKWFIFHLRILMRYKND